tara:strand:+ start:168 stop:1937 length:1770 start_codon:yes stop_codon:yes gene_type:complete
MKILKSLNKKNLFLIFTVFFTSLAYAEDQPVDIWNIEKKSSESNSSVSQSSQEDIEINSKNEFEIFNMQKQKNDILVTSDENLNSKEIKIYGLYDPQNYDLDIDMWLNSDGDQIKNIFLKLDKIKLSKDSTEIIKIALLTNAQNPTKNISEKEFLNFKSNWLIKNSDLDLIEEYLIKNQMFNLQPNLTKYLVDQYLSETNIEKACEILSQNLESFNNEYLSKFNIYCLIYLGKKEEAQLIFDLKKELGFSNKYFEKKINYLLGYTSEIDNTISEKSIFDFYLAHQSDPNFVYEPKDSTKKIIWKYLSSSGLLKSFELIEISELNKISTLEKATNDKNYPEKDLLEIYKRFQFNINQLLNVKQSYKTLSNIEGRALIYQKILLESELVEKLKLLKLLKDSFKSDNLENAFDIELKKFLEQINPTEVPDNLTSFYYTNIEIKENDNSEKKFNKDVLHQSKLINYFNGDFSKSKIEKDVNNFLKKVKKNKKYFFSKKDQIFLESLKFDGIKISKKYDDLYQSDDSEIPSDIQVMINNNEKGLVLLRIAEVIGQDKLERIDEDTIYFIIRTLNQLNIDQLRNKILLKVLPLKV